MNPLADLSTMTERAVGRRWLLSRVALGLSGVAGAALLPRGASAASLGTGWNAGAQPAATTHVVARVRGDKIHPQCNGDYCGSVCTNSVNLCAPFLTYCDKFCGPGCSYYANCRCLCLCGC